MPENEMKEPLGGRAALERFQSLLSEADEEWSRLDFFRRYRRGEHRLPYTPETATQEFRTLAKRSVTNLMPMVIDTQVSRLKVEGFRPDTGSDDDDAHGHEQWQWWQANGLDARQKHLYDAVATYGYAYVLVWPTESGTPSLSPRSPLTWYVDYTPGDEWASGAVRVKNDRGWFLDDVAMYEFRRDATARAWRLVSVEEHNLGVCPLVVFDNSWPLDDKPVGEVEPLIQIQDRLNQTVFDLLVAQTYAAAPQKYIAGLELDPDDDSASRNVASALSHRVWLLNGADSKVGQLPEARLDNLIASIDNTIRLFGIKSQTPAQYLLGELVNVSESAIVASDASLQAKVADRQALYGESWEKMFRLAAVAAGRLDLATDQSSQVIWAATDLRSLASTVDALGKAAKMLGIPQSELWARLPGVTQQDVARWKRTRAKEDPLDAMLREANFDGLDT